MTLRCADCGRALREFALAITGVYGYGPKCAQRHMVKSRIRKSGRVQVKVRRKRKASPGQLDWIDGNAE